MIIMGIDPGLERLGVGVIEKKGSQLRPVHYCLVNTAPTELSQRLKQIHQQVADLLSHYQPDALALEKLFFTKNQTTAFDVAKSIGCVLLAAADHECPVTEYSPPEIKKAVVGNGQATKTQVQYMVTRILGLKETPKPDDVADALAIAITHALKGQARL